MKTIRLYSLSSILIGLCAFLFPSSGVTQSGWITFREPEEHYVVQYPSSWHPLTPGATSLDIINFPASERAHGAILNQTGAEIMIGVQPEDIKTVDEWILQNVPDDLVERDEKTPLSSPNPSGCLRIRKVVTKEEVGEGVYFIDTSYYCTTKNGIYRITLINRDLNPHQDELQRMTLKLALSLRIF